MAIETNSPIIATTIIISTNVKPDFVEVWTFILALAFLLCGVNEVAG
jgi:hypothetical protein